MTTSAREGASDFQEELWCVAERYVARTGGDAVAPREDVDFILNQWREMLDGVRDDRDAVADRVDWVAKWRVVNGYKERHISEILASRIIRQFHYKLEAMICVVATKVRCSASERQRGEGDN